MWKLIALSIVLELFEAYWQHSDTLLGSLAKGYHFYKKSIFLLLFMHIGYLYILYVSIAFSIFNWAIVVILLLKTIDIVLKINLIEKVFVKQKADDEFLIILETKTAPWLYLIGVFTYPYLLYLAFSTHFI